MLKRPKNESPKPGFLHLLSCAISKNKGREVLALFNSESKVNAMTLAYAAQLGFKVQKSNIDAQQIDKPSLITHGIVIPAFQVFNKLGCSWFFQETFLPANISIKVVLGLLFPTFSNSDIQFTKKKLIWRTYTTKEALPTTCRVKLIDQKEFAKAALDENIKAFIVHISSMKSKITIHPAREV